MKALNCVLIQPDTRWADRASNRDHLAGLMDRAGPADLFVLPETCTTGFLGDLDGQAPGAPGTAEEAEGRADVDWLHAEAERRGSAIAAGLAVIDGGRRFNRLLFAMPDGISARYDKRHLFAYGGEGERYSAGTRRSRVSWRGWRFDLQICYDLRFPDLFRGQALAGAEILTVPAAFTRQTGEAHWHVLLRARAIENGAFLIAAAQGGTHADGRETYGHSMIVDPWGRILAEKDDDEPGVITAEIDLDAVLEARQKIPNLKNIRPFNLVDAQ